MTDPSNQNAEGTEDHATHGDHDFTGPLSPGVARFIKVFVAIAVVLAALDLLIHRTHHHEEGGPHNHISVDTIPTFYAIYGFVGCVILVLVAKEMRKAVMRSESYYEPAEESPLKDADEGAH